MKLLLPYRGETSAESDFARFRIQPELTEIEIRLECECGRLRAILRDTYTVRAECAAHSLPLEVNHPASLLPYARLRIW